MLQHTYRCSSCQLYQRLRLQLLALQQARRGFALTAATSQQHQTPNAPRFSNPSYQTPRPRIQHREHDEAAIRHDRRSDVARGRYSGQPLQPAHILSQLAVGRDEHTQSPSSRTVKRVSTTVFSDALRAKVDEFIQLKSLGVTPEGQWPLMQDMAREAGAHQLVVHKEFVHNYIASVLRTCKMSSNPDEQTTAGPRVSELLALMPAFGITDTDLYARALWRMARVILYGRASPSANPQKPAVVLEEMMAVWNLALRARLQRQESNEPRPSISNRPTQLDWSFLPPLSAFSELLAQQQRGTSAFPFERGLALLLPELQKGQGPDMKVGQWYDYASPALVMIDALRRAPGTQQRDDNSPFVELLELMLRALPSAANPPPGIRFDLQRPRDEGTGWIRELELVAERMGVAFTRHRQAQEPQNEAERVPPHERDAQLVHGRRHGVMAKQVRAEHGATASLTGPSKRLQDSESYETAQLANEKRHTSASPNKPPTERPPPRQRGKMLFSHQPVGEGELTVSEGEEFTVIEADSGDGWLKVRIGGEEDGSEYEGFVPASYVELVEMVGGEAAVQQINSKIRGTTGPAEVSTEDMTTGAESFRPVPHPPLADGPPAHDSTNTGAMHATSPVAGNRDAIADRFANLRINRLGQAVQKQDIAFAEQLKREILNFASNAINPPLRDQVYEHLMLALLTLRNPSSAIEVWNYFGQSLEKLGRRPSVKTYTVMMKGAQHVRDGQGMEAFWGKMRAAGVQPDINAWTTRIFGLIKGGRVEDGLKALSELGGEWVNAARKKHAYEIAPDAGAGSKSRKPRTQVSPVEEQGLSASQAAALYDGDIEGVPRPDVTAMNAAITALALRADRHISKVLTWGCAFGVEPDSITYNTLLNVSFHRGEADEAMAILQRMREKNIETTGSTWTVLLTQVFEGRILDGLTPEGQKNTIMGLVEAASAGSGGGVDIKGYTLAIDRLLKRHNNADAANALLTHMSLHTSLQPTPHLYTIFMNYYFQQQPSPNFQAIEALWQQIQAVNGGRGAPLDSIFYDRMLEGYATYHGLLNSTQQIQNLLQRVRKGGRRPSWRALELVARALAERGEWGVLLRIVDEARAWVREDKGAASEEMLVGNRRFGQVDFWRFVIETGLLREEGVTSVEQLERGRTGKSPMERRMGSERARRSP
ncbi:hypothetical protein LTR73_005677 [Friedmanniomyces endolithicus]|nr:hypothetical protein LTR73_005677 [Friedmanniomyces endolithicus]